MTKYLGTASTRFLNTAADDIAVTKYLNGPPEFNENDISVTKFMEQTQDDIAVTKYLGQRSNDIVVTMFQNLDTTVTKFLGDQEITIIEFLDSVLPKYLEDNDISVTKFLDHSIAEFLAANDISVTKFLDANDISVTKFLNADTAISNYPFTHEYPDERHFDSNEYDTRPSRVPRHDHYVPDHEPRELAHERHYSYEHERPHYRDWDEDLYHRPHADYHRSYEHARTVYPEYHEHFDDYHHEMDHARTVYPHDYPYHHEESHRQNQATTKPRSKPKMTRGQKDEKE